MEGSHRPKSFTVDAFEAPGVESQDQFFIGFGMGFRMDVEHKKTVTITLGSGRTFTGPDVTDLIRQMGEALDDVTRARITLGEPIGVLLADLQAKLQAARECRDAAQTEATRQTLLAREYLRQLDEAQQTMAMTSQPVNAADVRAAFDEGFALSRAGLGLVPAWDTSEAKQVASFDDKAARTRPRRR